MSATRLLVLAFVRARGCAHGYRISQDMLAWRTDTWANTKTGSIYHALRQLTKDGMLSAREEQEGENAPARTDYRITPAGEREFASLMEQALTEPSARPDMLCAGLAFMSALPRATVLAYLMQLLEKYAEQRVQVRAASNGAQWTGENALPPHVNALLDFWTHTTACRHAWVQLLIDTISSGAYVFADEDPNCFGTPGSRMMPQ